MYDKIHYKKKKINKKKRNLHGLATVNVLVMLEYVLILTGLATS